MKGNKSEGGIFHKIASNLVYVSVLFAGTCLFIENVEVEKPMMVVAMICMAIYLLDIANTRKNNNNHL